MAEVGALYMPNQTKTDSSHKIEKISNDLKTSRTADQLSPHHDSQFSAFSNEVLVRKSRDTIAVVLPLLP